MTEQARCLRRNLVDLALTACEEANVAGHRRPEPWVLVLAVELQQEQRREVRVPADAPEALSVLLALQRAYLPLPGAECGPHRLKSRRRRGSP